MGLPLFRKWQNWLRQNWLEFVFLRY